MASPLRNLPQAPAIGWLREPNIDFVRAFLTPARFVGRSEDFEARRAELNAILAFSGLEYGADGQFRQIAAARTLDEAEARVRTIKAKFQGRSIHGEVLKYCRSELLQDNYFHAVFEAAKGLAQRIRELAGVDADGAALVDLVFSIDRPLLAFNTLRTETEKVGAQGLRGATQGMLRGRPQSAGAPA